MLPAWAQRNLPPIDPAVACKDFGKVSVATKVISAEQVEASAQQQYAQMMSKASSQRALAPDSHPQVQRLRAIADRIVPFTNTCNPRASQWKWEINLLGSQQLNAFCMPGGKIAFFLGILSQLQLDDDEVAAIMGHEMAHALREHARERMGKTAATRIGAGVLSAFLGLGNTGDTLLNMGGQLLTLKFSRDDETEADVVGLDLAARAGYDPRAMSTVLASLAAQNVLSARLLGAPGAGKTMLARALRGLLPPLSEREVAEVAAVRALLTPSDGVALPVPQRVCVAPSIDASRTALFGGGRRTVPGAVSRAHRGLLLLDGLPAFGVKLARLPTILDDRSVLVEGAGSAQTLPAAFQLVATARPCPCGWFGDPEAICTCTSTGTTPWKTWASPWARPLPRPWATKRASAAMVMPMCRWTKRSRAW